MGLLSVVKAVPNGVVKAGGRLLTKLAKDKPQIMLGGGLVIAAGGFVLAIINARKLDGAMEASNAKVDELEQKQKDIQASANLSEAEQKEKLKEVAKELNKARAEAAWKIFTLIGVPSLMFAGGAAIAVGGHVILVRRFGQLSAGFAALKESFDRYRAMNIAEHGSECDRRYIYGITGSVDGKETITGPDGKEKTVKTKLPAVDMENGGAGLYSFVFSEDFSRKCPKDPVNSIAFLQAQQKYWNIWMQAKNKPVTLSMVLDDLGIELDPDDPMNDYIYIAGWRPNGDGDNYIDFGIMRACNKRTLNMEENIVMLNFNCDGNIFHSARYDKNGKKVCG